MTTTLISFIIRFRSCELVGDNQIAAGDARGHDPPMRAFNSKLPRQLKTASPHVNHPHRVSPHFSQNS